MPMSMPEPQPEWSQECHDLIQQMAKLSQRLKDMDKSSLQEIQRKDLERVSLELKTSLIVLGPAGKPCGRCRGSGIYPVPE